MSEPTPESSGPAADPTDAGQVSTTGTSASEIGSSPTPPEATPPNLTAPTAPTTSPDAGEPTGLQGSELAELPLTDTSAELAAATPSQWSADSSSTSAPLEAFVAVGVAASVAADLDTKQHAAKPDAAAADAAAFDGNSQKADARSSSSMQAMASVNGADDDLSQLTKLKEAYDKIRAEVGRRIVGQEEVIEQLFMCIFARGHCILEGVPGLAKTLMVSTLAQSLSLAFNRIQFTPDLMPSDITGTEVLREDRNTGVRTLQFVRGPIFANVVLADEINRTPPKTQAALLEGMQERQVSIGGVRHELPDPFFVLATQNPIEQEGTYPLPEAQLDRFLFKVFVSYPTEAEERQIYRLTTGNDLPELTPVLDAEEILLLQRLVRKVPISDHALDYAMALVRATRTEEYGGLAALSKYIAWGAGPRAGQALILGAKARAALAGRTNATTDDLRAVAKPVLRHRLVTTYAAQAEGHTTDKIVERLLDLVPVRSSAEKTHEDVAQVLRS